MLWASIGALTAVIVETSFRRWPDVSWLGFWPIALPGALIINYAIFRVMRESTSLLDGFIVFSTMTMGLRIFATFLLGERPGWQDWMALGLLAGARMVQTLR